MKKIYCKPEIEVIDIASERVLALSVHGKPNTGGGGDDWANRYDTAAGRRSWGNLWEEM
ncbi:MAG: hypothetical protein IKL29_06360 [Bacteroidaceae bacterium]|nr:hypothetical protein [Bacteroidaceae bacterium]